MTLVSLLIGTCSLTLLNLRHCLVYALPTLTFFAGTLYLIKRGDLHFAYTIAGVLLFIAANTLFVYAATRQMLKEKPGALQLRESLIWRREHNDFFFFFSIGMLLAVVLIVYFIDAINNLFSFADSVAQQGVEQMSEQNTNYVDGSYTVLAFGSRLLSTILLGVVLVLWWHLCRMGIRIPAHVEGYFLRSDEAKGLMQAFKFTTLAVSLLLITSINVFAEILFEEMPPGSVTWLPALIWSGVYFFLMITHLAMWVHLYIHLAKKTNYHMSLLI